MLCWYWDWGQREPLASLQSTDQTQYWLLIHPAVAILGIFHCLVALGRGGTIRIEMAAFPRRITPRRLSKRSSVQFGKKTATEFSSGHTRQILSDDILNVTFNGAPVQAGLHALRLGRGRPFPVLAGNQKDKGVKGGLFQL